MRLVFMGTPEFAVPSLKTLLDSHHFIAGVATGPDKRAGRGLKIAASPVKTAARTANLPIIQPEDLTDTMFLRQLHEWHPDCIVVVAFRILPASVFTIPPKGTVNLHASLLPFYRGAAPIHWVIINGETKTGITTFLINEKVDQGGILSTKELSIAENETSGELASRMAVEGAGLLLETLNQMEYGTLHPRLQPNNGSFPKAPKITKEACVIDWTQRVHDIHNRVRGLSPIPGAFTHLRERIIKILHTGIYDETYAGGGLPGTIIDANRKKGLLVQCGMGALEIMELMPEGKRAMNAKAFLAGFRNTEGDRFC